MRRTARPGPRADGWPVVLLSLLALLLAGCGGDETALEAAEDAGRAAPLVGETITVTGRISDVLTTSAVMLNADWVDLGAEAGTLVYSLEEGTFRDLDEGDLIRVTGTVERFLVEEVHPEGFDAAAFNAFDDEFAVEAESYELVAEDAEER